MGSRLASEPRLAGAVLVGVLGVVAVAVALSVAAVAAVLLLARLFPDVDNFRFLPATALRSAGRG
jgi:hypothetical protein